MKIIVITLALILSGALAYIRLAPTDPARWHVDPEQAANPGPAGWRVAPTDGDAAGAVFAVDATTLLTELDAIATALPRTRRIAGAPETGRMTYETRSRVFGFPDYTTVSAAQVDADSTSPVILARLRFGGSDLGVNRRRVEGMLAMLSARLAPAG